MRTIELNLYQFDELSKEAQEKALRDNYAINVDFDWWDSTYEDAKNVGIQINGFGLDRDKHCTIELKELPEDVAGLIYNNHGSNCDTHKAAKDFLTKFDTLEGDDYDEALKNFEKELAECYAEILQGESEYLMSDEAVKETLIANEYEFTENGDIY